MRIGVLIFGLIVFMIGAIGYGLFHISYGISSTIHSIFSKAPIPGRTISLAIIVLGGLLMAIGLLSRSRRRR